MFIVAIALMSLVVMWLWNLLIPDLFHGPEVNYLQAAGLLVLTRLLVGIRGRHHWWAPWAKRRWKRKWMRHPRGRSATWDRWSAEGDGLSQEEWQAVKNRWKAEFGEQMKEWSKEWKAKSYEERKKYEQEHPDAKGKEWRLAWRFGFKPDSEEDDRATGI